MFKNIQIKKEHLILLLIFFVSILIRYLLDPNIPYHYDPGKNIVYARAALQWFPLVPQYNPYFNLGEYYEYQVLFPYTVALFYKISGISLIIITKWLAIISGAALSLTVYYLSLEIFNNKMSALISAFFIAVSRIQLMAYMNYYPQIMAMAIMPVSFVFLIRYFKYERLKYLILVVITFSLVVLTSYLAAFVYLLIILISTCIRSIRYKKSILTTIIIFILTALLLTFFWLPIVWHHGAAEFMKTFIDTILRKPAPFTNQPWTLVNFLMFSSSTVIAIVTGITVILFIKRVKWDFSRLLIAVWLVLTFILMESYLFRSIFWADRYYQFFDIILLLLAGRFLTTLIDKSNNIKKIQFKYKGYILLILLIYPLYGAINVNYTFGKWGYPSDISMLDYMGNLPPGSLVATPPSIHSFWVSALSGVNVLGGESPGMFNHQYLGDNDSNLIINSPDVNQKMNIIRKYGVNYIFIPIHKPVYMVWNPSLDKKGIEAFNNSTYFKIDRIIEDTYGVTVLVKVQENLLPKYNAAEINWSVTAAGYLISIISLLIFVYIYRSDSS